MKVPQHLHYIPEFVVYLLFIQIIIGLADECKQIGMLYQSVYNRATAHRTVKVRPRPK